MTEVTIFKSIHNTSAGFHRDVFSILDRIKSGKSQALIEKIRSEQDKEKRNELKKQLPAICFSGTFNQRADDKMLKHSGLICLDFDKYDSGTDYKNDRDKLIKNPFTFALFESPSGNGLKVIVKIPDSHKDHRLYFEALRQYFDNPHFDPSSINESRVCYESYDPELFINKNSETWTTKLDNKQYEVGKDKAVLPLKSDNQIIQNLLKWHSANFPLISGQRNNNLFKLAAALNDFGINKSDAEQVLDSVNAGSLNEREVKNVLDSAYKNIHSFGTKFFEDEAVKKKIEKQIRSGTDMKEIKKEFSQYEPEQIEDATNVIKDNMSITEFWDYTKNGAIKMSPHKFKLFLEQNGFFKLYPSGAENFIFVLIRENLISNTSNTHIKDFVLKYLFDHKGGLRPYDFMATSTKFFKEDYLSLLDTADVQMKEDTKDKCYLYYSNCAVEVCSDGIKEIDYLELDGYIWEKHIIDREFKQVDPTECVFEKFISKISGDDSSRFKSLISVIGYLLHSFKTGSDNKAIIFNDEVISENPNGGSGKGMICNAIGHMKRVATLDGKQFDFNKSFPYQTVSADTQILVFDDVKRNFQFENLFSLVTEGITLEKKNKDAIKLPVHKSPKIAITTNYTIAGEGGSFERRKFEVELSSYFNANHTPFDEFGHMLFDQWDSVEWSKFDNFMILCIQYYLKFGLTQFEFHNLNTRKFINSTSYEFYEFIKDEEIPMDEPINRTDYYEKFLDEYEDFKNKNWCTRRKFGIWMDKWADYNNWDKKAGKSNGIRYIMYSNNNIVEQVKETQPF